MQSDYPEFRVGKTRVITMENFEALGRYVTASEQAAKFADERNNHLRSAKSLIERASMGYSGVTLAYDFDANEVRGLIDKAEEANINMHKAAEEANRQADLCGKHKLKIEKPYR